MSFSDNGQSGAERPSAGSPGLVDVLPAAAAALGIEGIGRGAVTLPGTGTGTGTGAGAGARAVVVVLVDGLGDVLLRRRGGHAPFLRRLHGAAGPGPRTLQVTYPSTTATGMGSFGTGRLPGSHGLVGLEVLDPDRDVLFSELGWDPDVDPRRWQPVPTVFEQLLAADRDVVRIGPAYFEGSGLTEAALRGGRFVGAPNLARGVEAALAAVPARRSNRRALIYLYWGELDKTGHVFGCESWQWGEELTQVDSQLRRLAERLPPDVLLVVTADHGMVDVPLTDRVDLAHEPELLEGVRHVGGEPRAPQLYCSPGAAEDVAAAWAGRFEDDLLVLTRAEAIERGWFGEVHERVEPRIGDVLAVARSPLAVVDSRRTRPEVLRLIGLHGALTDDEVLVPLLVTPGGA
ncbi:MAG: hypothetical protein QG608_964 [Actinomycetota bacterium]|nr:hypothetical protein [Actinomycetota bacterium]